MLKHNDNLENKEKVKYDLYKILRMSVLLSSKEVDELTLKKFRDASFNIDRMLSETYDEKLETMFYNTTTLEDEEKRLKDLIAFINERIEKRKGLMEDYKSVTSSELIGLDYINRSGELDLYKKRLDTIGEYLNSSKLIEVNEKDLEILKEELVKEYDIKAENEIKNSKIEDSLFNTFVNALYEMDLYNSLELSNIDGEIESLQKDIEEALEQKDTFTTAFENLKASGITGDLEIEYSSYVENSKRNYYYIKEKEIVLNLYKLMELKEAEYSDLYVKREKLKKLLKERYILRNELGIKEEDFLAKVCELIEEQEHEIESEKDNIDNINVLTERIKLKENRLEELKKTLSKPEMLAILKEYSLIDTYEHEEILNEVEEIMSGLSLSDDEMYEEVEAEAEENNEILLEDLLVEEEQQEQEQETNDEELKDEILKNELQEELSAPKTFEANQIKEIRTVPTMNFGLSRLKSISVMKRVGDMLGVNAKKSDEVVETSEVKVEEPKIVEQPELKENIVQGKKDELFWTPAEFVDMKMETEGTTQETKKVETNVADIFVPDVPMFEAKMPEMKEEKSPDIFVTGPTSNEMIFPESVMPEMGQKILPENNEDKFMWPDNMETFDINGIFPS